MTTATIPNARVRAKQLQAKPRITIAERRFKLQTTSGGSSDSELNELAVKPTNRFGGPGAQMTATPVANWAMALRNCRSLNGRELTRSRRDATGDTPAPRAFEDLNAAPEAKGAMVAAGHVRQGTTDRETRARPAQPSSKLDKLARWRNRCRRSSPAAIAAAISR